MSDGVKAAIGQFARDTGEALVEPVVDQVGQALEQGAQVAMPASKPVSQDSPADQAKREAENAQKLQAAQATIARYEKIEEEIAQIRMKKKQEEQAKQQVEQQEKQEKGFELQKQERKSVDIAVSQAKTRTETKGGVGG